MKSLYVSYLVTDCLPLQDIDVLVRDIVTEGSGPPAVLGAVANS
jgi:hypothetical protein